MRFSKAHPETNTQYNLPAFPKRIKNQANRLGIADRFTDPLVAKSIQADVQLLDAYHRILLDLEAHILRQARHDDPAARICRSPCSSCIQFRV